MINSLCILGGGTSGLVAALMMRRAWPELKITMIESSQLGIIGVGEGSTEHWRKFMDHIGVNVPQLMRETGATYKIGIKFTNWQGDGKHYFHSLSEQFGHHSPENGLPYQWLKFALDKEDPLNTVWSYSANSLHAEPLHQILYQYHFDTFKLNDFLHRLCKERNIEVVDTQIKDVILDDDGYVKELVDENNQTHAYDFYFDCSGFRRIIGSKLGVEWIDCSEQLPMNSAIAFPTGYTEDIPSYTESTALSSGWVWRIPTQERYGNGYVFCDDFINETQAYDEVSEHYSKNLGIKETLEIGRKVKFKAGHVNKFWTKNCVMIGLSGIFVEPLEASSIGTTIQQCFYLLPTVFHYQRGETHTEQQYNKNIEGISKNIIDFIQLHYLTKRDDSEFWRWVKNNIKLTDFNRNNLDYFKKSGVNPHYFNDPMKLFSHMNYYQVMLGLDMFDAETIRSHYYPQMAKYDHIIKELEKESAEFESNLKVFKHREAINILKERYLEKEFNVTEYKF